MEQSLLHRKESIIISTVETLNQVGLQNLSTKLIAKCEGVSEGTLFRHFKNKSEIMIAVIDHFSKFDNAIVETINNKRLSPIEAIKNFVNSYAEYYSNYPEITAVVQAYDSLMADCALNEKIRLIINKRSDFLVKTIEEGQENGTIKPDIKSETLETLITGGIREICLKWRMENFQFSLKDKVLEMLDTLLEAFTVKD